MIKRLPGWLNFIVLCLFYLLLTSGVIFLWRILSGSYPSPYAQNFLVGLFYAGGYLSKWRENQGCGWSFW